MRTRMIEWAGRLAGRDAVPLYRDMLEGQFLDREAQEARLLEGLNRLLAHHARNPVYAALAGEALGLLPLRRLEDLRAFPVVTKAWVTQSFDRLFEGTDRYSLDSTSGSTGRNFRFYHCRGARIAQSASVRLAHGFIGSDYYRDRKVAVWGVSPGGWRSRVVHGLQRLLLGAEILPAYGMDDERAAAYLVRLARRPPRILGGYPSYLLHLARAGRERGLVPPAVEALVVSGEQMFPEQQAELEAYFEAPVYSRYGSREFGCIAHECHARNGLHVLPGRFIVEEGPGGHLLVTDLHNRATPFIRYDIGDAGEVSWVACACGRHLPTIRGLRGRANDYLRTPGGKVLPAQFWTTLSRKVAGVEAFQVVQKALDHLEVRVVDDGAFTEASASTLREAVAGLVGAEVRVEVVRVPSIPVTPSGKRRFVISELV